MEIDEPFQDDDEKLPFRFKKQVIPVKKIRASWERIAAKIAANKAAVGREEFDEVHEQKKQEH